MNNPNPFLPHGAFLEQKNKARTRFKIAVSVSISLSVMVLMVLLIQGCKKPTDTAEGTGTDTNSLMSQLPTNAPDLGTTSNTAMTPPPVTNPPVYTPPPVEPPPAPPVATTEDYTIVTGDTYAKIGGKMHVSTKAIADANPGVDPKKLKIGQKIHIPAPATAAPTTSAPTSATPDTAAIGTAQTYKVKSGDNLTTIAKHFHVTVKAIQSANNLTTTSIKVGQVLKIPGAAAPAPVPAPTETLPPPSLSAPTSAPAATTLPPPAH